MRRFLKDEDGAVTVDWVVLTASIVGFGISVAGAVALGTTNLAGDASTEMADRQLGVEGAWGTGGDGGGNGDFCAGVGGSTWCYSDSDGNGDWDTRTVYDDEGNVTSENSGYTWTEEDFENDPGADWEQMT